LAKTWIVKRSYENFIFLDKQVHQCVFDRKISMLPELPLEENLNVTKKVGQQLTLLNNRGVQLKSHSGQKFDPRAVCCACLLNPPLLWLLLISLWFWTTTNFAFALIIVVVVVVKNLVVVVTVVAVVVRMYKYIFCWHCFWQ